MHSRRKANLTRPTTIEEANQRLFEVETEIGSIKAMLEVGMRLRDDGLPMTPDEYIVWRKRATGAMNWYIKERTVISRWIKGYEQDARAEEKAEQKASRLAAHQQQQESALHRKEELVRQWRERIVELESKPSSELTKSDQEERLRLEKQVAKIIRVLTNDVMVRQQMKEAKDRKREKQEAHQRMMQEQAQLAAGEPIDPSDPYNLLRHAYRVLVQMAREKRVAFTENEQTFVNLLERIGRQNLKK